MGRQSANSDCEGDCRRSARPKRNGLLRNLGQFTLAIRAEVKIETILDTIQPYPTFSEGVFYTLQELQGQLS